jgi:tetratricopeptide (TPR) repeat protein
LIGVNGESRPRLADVVARLTSDPRLAQDLRFAHWGGPAHSLHQPHVLLGGFLMGPDGLAALAADAAVYCDDRPILDYAVRGVLPVEHAEVAAAELIRAHLEPLERWFRGDIPPGERARIAAVRDANVSDLAASGFLREAYVQLGRAEPRVIGALAAEALRWNPESFEATRMLAEVRLLERRFDEAVTLFSSAQAMRAEDLPTLRGLGVAYLYADRPAQAIRSLNATLALDPHDAESHNNLGVAHAKRGELQTAKRHFEAALALRPDFPDASRNLERMRAAGTPQR